MSFTVQPFDWQFRTSSYLEVQEYIKKMHKEQAIKFLKDVGILYPDGTLHENYGGRSRVEEMLDYLNTKTRKNIDSAYDEITISYDRLRQLIKILEEINE